MVMLLAAALALAAGLALQRGGVCAVLAVREAIEDRRWRRFVSFVECAAWSLIGLLAADAAGWMSVGDWPAQPSLSLALLGGATFGAGALINGACAFGTIGRIAAGESAFLAMPVGFVAGALGARMLGASAGHASGAAFSSPAFAFVISVLVAFALLRLWSGAEAAPGLRAAIGRFMAPQWPPPLAMAVMAGASVSLMLLVYSWPYTSLLVDVASRAGVQVLERALLACALLAGAFVGAWSAGRFALRTPRPRALTASLCGGALMGAGATLVPGGNDALVLIGIPLLQPAAFAAYAAMIAAIALGFLARRYLTRAQRMC